jgi:hypothetical protein
MQFKYSAINERIRIDRTLNKKLENKKEKTEPFASIISSSVRKLNMDNVSYTIELN